MGLTRSYKTEVFFTFILAVFSRIFNILCYFYWWHLSKKPEIYLKPNFDKISQSTAEIKLLSVKENGRPPYWNSISGFYFDVSYVYSSTCHFTSVFQISWKSDDRRRSYDLISMAIIQSEIYFRVQVLLPRCM